MERNRKTVARVERERERESLYLENRGFVCNAKNIAEKLYIKYKEIKVNMLFKYGGDAT